MSNISRTGDIAVGVCFGHLIPVGVTGTIVSGSTNAQTSNTAIARVGDIVSFDCGHIGIITSGINTCLCDNKPLAHIGSIVVGPMIATVISGDPTSIGS